MKMLNASIPFLILLLCGCNTIKNEDLIGGTWYPIDENESDKIEDYNCDYFTNGIQFVTDEKAITEEPETIYEYKVTKGKSNSNLYLHIPRFSRIKFYSIDKVSSNEIILHEEGYSDKRSCHMERLP